MAFVGSSFVLRSCRMKFAPVRLFSTSQPVLVDLRNIFSRKNSVDESESERSDLQMAQSEIARSSTFGSYEKSALQRIISKGLGKIIIAYEPPDNVGELMKKIYREVFGIESAAEPLEHRFTDRATKFRFLTACEQAFSHSLSNSQLHQIQSVGDVLHFYMQPVAGTNGLTQYQTMPDLPANLHINYEPTRFDPANDPIYGGITAFPHTHNYVTGLKYKKLYKGRRAETNWPKVLDCAPLRRNQFPQPFRRD